jgi:hypothetical protein
MLEAAIHVHRQCHHHSLLAMLWENSPPIQVAHILPHFIVRLIRIWG